MTTTGEPETRRPWFRQEPELAIVVAVVLYASIFVWRILEPEPADAISLMYSFPIALLAFAFGLRAALGGALLGIVLIAAWTWTNDVHLPWDAWLSRAGALILLGVLLGFAVDQLERSEHRRQRLEAAAMRQRDAAEINDSIVQSLSAAKWAFEAGQTERGIAVVDETLGIAQDLVAHLLRDAAVATGDVRRVSRNGSRRGD